MSIPTPSPGPYLPYIQRLGPRPPVAADPSARQRALGCAVGPCKSFPSSTCPTFPASSSSCSSPLASRVSYSATWPPPIPIPIPRPRARAHPSGSARRLGCAGRDHHCQCAIDAHLARPEPSTRRGSIHTVNVTVTLSIRSGAAPLPPLLIPRLALARSQPAYPRARVRPLGGRPSRACTCACTCPSLVQPVPGECYTLRSLLSFFVFVFVVAFRRPAFPLLSSSSLGLRSPPPPLSPSPPTDPRRVRPT